MNSKTHRLMRCVNNGGCEDLNIRMVYEILPDDNAAKDNYVRVIDESGEDYLYPEGYFSPIEISA